MNAVSESTLRVIGNLYVEACQEICAAYDLPVHLDVGARPDPGVVPGLFKSVLSLNNADFRLTSRLTIEHALLYAAHRAMMPEGTPFDVEDWGREFSNQVGGRLKNKLLPLDLVVRVGLAASGALAAAPVDDVPTEVRRCYFTWEKGWLAGELAMHLAPGFELPEIPERIEGEALLEGMYLMF